MSSEYFTMLVGMAKLPYWTALLSISSVIASTKGSRFCVWNSTHINSTARSCIYSVHCTEDIAFKDIHTTEGYPEVEAYFCSTDYSLDETVELPRFINTASISAIGVSPSSNIHCNNSNFGLFFKNVRHIILDKVMLIKCGFQNENLPFISAVSIINSTVITITSIGITGSSGFGIALVDNNGRINITSSTFEENFNTASEQPGGGVLIESSTNEHAAYHIDNCNFTRNAASNTSGTSGDNFGGGINAQFKAKTNSVHLTITDCMFEANTAKHGGGISLFFQESAHTVAVSKPAFCSNYTADGGGDVAVQGTAKNLVLFKSCYFSKNSGRNGGGVYLYAENDNNFQFHECIWTENEGTYGSAILFSRSSFTEESDPSASFRSCSFADNINKEVSLSETMNATVFQYGRGALYANLFTITFSGNTTFIGNKRKSAIYLFSSTLEITAGSYMLFERNIGYQGGAINLRGLSSIHINDNVYIDFDSNFAWNSGGAIYHASLVDPSRLTEASCFIQYVGQHNKSVADRHATLHFVNNTINHGLQQSIFLSSTISCKGENSTIEKALNSTATFLFEDGMGKGTIVTYPSSFSTTHENIPKLIVPGKETALGISATNDVFVPVYRIEISLEVRSNITINPAYTIITNNVVKMRGKPNSKGIVKLKFLEEDDLALSFEVILDECPPGYIYSNQLSACQCSANTQTPYLGVTRCNSTVFQAYLTPGYWAGYVSNDTSEQSFRTSGCPLGYCTTEFSEDSEVRLPARASSRDISDTVCVSSRMGVMCSECKKNTSARYHTQWTYDCGSEEKCHLGFLLFAVTQIVPVTILFLVVIFFDIQLNTGALNGFLFFMQVLSIFNLTANNIIKVPKITENFLMALYSIIKAFNLDFFVIPGLDFCLFKGANPLDLLSLDYVLVVYSLLLVLFTITCLNRRWTTRVKRLRGRRILRTSSIIHGLSGFLVLCYVKTTTVTLRILTPGYIRGKGLRQHEIVNFYYGSISFFSKQHLKYAIPALFALIFMTTLPPLLLWTYPLCYRVLAALKVEESKFAKVLCKAIPLEKFKPLFDSLQGEFKDNHRYYAGLYFTYRLVILLSFVIAKDLTSFYCYLELQLILMCALHGWLQPYKKNWYNRLDLLLFTLLARSRCIITSLQSTKTITNQTLLSSALCKYCSHSPL